MFTVVAPKANTAQLPEALAQMADISLKASMERNRCNMTDHTKQFTARATMDRETIQAYEDGVPTSVARDIARDHIGKSTSLPTVPSVSWGKPGINYADEVPIAPPPGIALMDAMMAQDDRLWRRDLKARLGVKDDDGPKAA
jgi:hypothetical protein